MITRLLVIASVLAVSLEAQPSSRLPEQANEQAHVQTNPETSQQPSSNTPVEIPDQPAPASGQQPGSQTDDQIAIQRDVAASTRMIARDTQKLADYTLWLAVVGGIVGLLTVGVLVLQALYTGQAAKAASRGLYLSSRPRVHATHIRLRGLDTGETLVGEVRLRNMQGHPPKRIDFIMGHRLPIDQALPEHPAYPPLDQWKRLSGPLVAGGSPQIVRQPFGRAISAAEVARYESEDLAAYVYGCVRYDDGFGNTPRVGFIRRVRVKNGRLIYDTPNKPHYNYDE